MAQKAGSRTLVDPILMRFAGYRSHFGARFSANLNPAIQRFAMMLTHAVLLFNMPDSTAPIVFTGEFAE
jgi:hypothetical protein